MDKAIYREKMGAYRLNADLKGANGFAKANPQFGKGGLEQIFIPDFQELLHNKFISRIDGVSFWINVIFDDNRMKIIELSDANETFQNSYNDWSNYRYEKKREAHDRWILRQLGRPFEEKTNALTFNRSWGSATSYTDMKNGEVKIMISYK
ncbi:hypothetical protein ABNN70_06915 [Sporolactobacillus sp. Y61]|uniref:Uncharacterized protein n=1 Tax=Sporolactobacillus sp. Y61 TaxID=3160863 RepID=A0AAU8IIW1_9BACL